MKFLKIISIVLIIAVVSVFFAGCKKNTESEPIVPTEEKATADETLVELNMKDPYQLSLKKGPFFHSEYFDMEIVDSNSLSSMQVIDVKITSKENTEIRLHNLSVNGITVDATFDKKSEKDNTLYTIKLLGDDLIRAGVKQFRNIVANMEVWYYDKKLTAPFSIQEVELPLSYGIQNSRESVPTEGEVVLDNENCKIQACGLVPGYNENNTVLLFNVQNKTKLTITVTDTYKSHSGEPEFESIKNNKIQPNTFGYVYLPISGPVSEEIINHGKQYSLHIEVGTPYSSLSGKGSISYDLASKE